MRSGDSFDHEQTTLLESNLLLRRSIRNRFPYIDPLHHIPDRVASKAAGR